MNTIKEIEQEINQESATSGRSCNGCTICCKVLLIDQPDIQKPANEWCKHCDSQFGCRIYATRPRVCRGFTCKWLVNPELGDEWWPKLSKIIQYELSQNEQHGWIFQVDVTVPNRWREEPYYSRIKQVAHNGLTGRHGLTGEPTGIKFKTVVVVGKEAWLITPTADLKIPDKTVATRTIRKGMWHASFFTEVLRLRG